MNSVRSLGGGGYAARVGPSWIETLARVTLCTLCTDRVDDENFMWDASVIQTLDWYILIFFFFFFFYRLRRKSCVSSFVFIVGIENGEVKFLIRWVTRWFLEGFLKRLILFFNIVSCICGKYSKRSKKFWLFVVYDYGDDKNYAIKLRTLVLLYPFIKILLNSFNTWYFVHPRNFHVRVIINFGNLCPGRNEFHACYFHSHVPGKI